MCVTRAATFPRKKAKQGGRSFLSLRRYHKLNLFISWRGEAERACECENREEGEHGRLFVGERVNASELVGELGTGIPTPTSAERRSQAEGDGRGGGVGERESTVKVVDGHMDLGRLQFVKPPESQGT